MNLGSAMAYVGGDYGPSAGAMVNIFFRIFFNMSAAASCWIPLRLFYKHEEVTGTSMVVAVALLNLFYAVNALLWPTDDIANWPEGYGWCDVQLILWVPLETLNAAAVCAVMQNIASQVSLFRASGLTWEEKRRKRIVQACTLFPVPVLQVLLYYFVIAMRYNISGIVGCQAVFDPDWIFLVFFILPCPLFVVAAAYYAVLTWTRYRKFDAVARKALLRAGIRGKRSSAARTRRKLYLMALTIVVPYCPMQMMFLFNNVRLGLPWNKTYDLGQLHSAGWNRLDYTPSTMVSFTSMYINYIAVFEVVVFFIYFGRTQEAKEMYRGYMRALGLDRIFPSLHNECHPSDPSSTTLKTLWYRAKSISATFTHTRSSSSLSHITKESLRKHRLNHHEDSQVFELGLQSLDLEAARAISASSESQSFQSSALFLRPIFTIPRMPMPAFLARKRLGRNEMPDQNSPGSLVALLGNRQFAGSNRAGNLAKANGSSETPSRADFRRIPLSLPIKWTHSRGSQAEKKHLASVAAACVPEQEEEKPNKFCTCGEYLWNRGVQDVKQQADFERGLISIKRDFASK